jgi:ATP-dependent RNA/DNA helicase IGHMBP2
MTTDDPKWTKHQRELLEFERECEKSELTDKIGSLSAKECEDAGLSLLSMAVGSSSTALFGRCCLTMVRSNNQLLLKTFKVGDEVVMYCPKLKHTTEYFAVEGIVAKLLPASIDIICDEVDETLFDESIRIDLRANDGTHKKYLKVLDDLEESSHPLVNLLFGGEEFQSMSLRSSSSNSDSASDISQNRIEFQNTKLNKSQMDAVVGALKTKYISLIHGPPGTGKTSTVVEVIHQSAMRRQRVLVCAPSNVAVDNILERLIATNETRAAGKGKRVVSKVRMVRLGHPARVSKKGARYCLDSLIASHDGTEIVSDVHTEINGLRKEILRCGKKGRSKRRELQGEIRVLCKEARKREESIVKEIMLGVDVVLCTCVTAGSRLLSNMVFDMVIIDEAAQALEVSCWIPIMIATKCILVGDHKQLPPTVKSTKAASKGLAVTLFERVMTNQAFLKADLVHLLDTQYRMNSLICDWASEHMYSGRLISHESVANRTLKDIYRRPPTAADGTSAVTGIIVELGSKPSIDIDGDIEDDGDDNGDCSEEGEERKVTVPSAGEEDEQDTLPVTLLLDTTGSGMYEEEGTEGSKKNFGEADLVLQHVLYLLDTMRVAPADIGVITPYSGQLGLLKQIFAEGSESDPRLSSVDVKTIDGYQGGEKECVVISMVRSNLRREVGFLGEKRRINVAVTRAKVHLAVICDVDTCSKDRFIGSLLDHMSAVGEHRSVFGLDPPPNAVLPLSMPLPYAPLKSKSKGLTCGSASSSSSSVSVKSSAQTAVPVEKEKASTATEKTRDISSSASSTATAGPFSTSQSKEETDAKAVSLPPSGGRVPVFKQPTWKGHAKGQAQAQAPSSKCVDYPYELQKLVHDFKAGRIELCEGVIERIEDEDQGAPHGAVGVVILRVRTTDRNIDSPKPSPAPLPPLPSVSAALSPLPSVSAALSPLPSVSAPLSPSPSPAFLRFPPTLDSYCRLIVHELATDLSLHHRSVGVPPLRCIEISSDPFSEDGTASPDIRSVLPLVLNDSMAERLTHTSAFSLLETEDLEIVIEEEEVAVPVLDPALEDLKRIRAEKFALSKQVSQTQPQTKTNGTKGPHTGSSSKRSSGKGTEKKGSGVKIAKGEGMREEEELDEAGELERAIRENEVQNVRSKILICPNEIVDALPKETPFRPPLHPFPLSYSSFSPSPSPSPPFSPMSRRENQYKMGSNPFPNPNSEDSRRKAHLRKMIEGAGDIRKGIDPSAAAGEEPKTKKPSRSKVLKKPPQKLGST